MKTFRRICIAVVAVSAVLLYFHRETHIPTLPFPAKDWFVRDRAMIAVSGDYKPVVTMTKVDDSLGLGPEEVSCSLVLSVSSKDGQKQKQEIKNLSRYGEFGFGNTQLFHAGNPIHLERGEYMFAVKSLEACAVAAERGATISFERDVGNPTDHYLFSLFAYYLETVGLAIGLVGLIVCEFIRPSRRQKSIEGQPQDVAS